MRQKSFFMKIRYIFLVLLFLILIIGVGAFVFITKALSPVNLENNSYSLNVPTGATAMSVGNILEEQSVIRSADIFYYYGRLKKISLKAGVYSVSTSMSVAEIYDILQSGKQEYVSVSIPEGRTISQIGEILEAKNIVSAVDFTEATRNQDLLKKYNIPSVSFEGYLFPETYFLTQNMSGTDVIILMVEEFYKKIATIDGLAEMSPEKLLYTVKLASIVEKEYRVVDEAPLIASVFTNRLKIGQGLYSCATVVYILTEELGRPHPDRVTYDDLKIDSPYNTYVYAGLPPTPISNPGLVALKAAANPPRTSYRYFRLTDEVKGTHVFSSDFDDHIEVGRTISTKR